METRLILPSPISATPDGFPDANELAALRAWYAGLSVRIPRRRQWWRAVPGLGAAGARSIEVFFAAHPALTERARALIAAQPRGDVVPWESLCLPHEVDGSAGSFRAPRPTCALDANDDYEAVQAWLLPVNW